jgi:purine-binding chemotaxis protein CheW
MLVVRVGPHTLALALSDVSETMRPLPIEAAGGLPPAVQGLAIIRGAPTPVVDLRVILGVPAGPAGRFVTVRAGDHGVALAVDEVAGVAVLDPARLGPPPALSTIDALDAEVVLVLRSMRLVEAAP